MDLLMGFTLGIAATIMAYFLGRFVGNLLPLRSLDPDGFCRQRLQLPPRRCLLPRLRLPQLRLRR